MYNKSLELKLCDEQKLVLMAEYYYGIEHFHNNIRVLENKFFWLFESKLSEQQTCIHWYEFLMYHLPLKMAINNQSLDPLTIMNCLNGSMLIDGPSETIKLLYSIYLTEIKK
jgi:hypothetical protein